MTPARCPSCGCHLPGGRPALSLTVTEVCDALRARRSVPLAAESLGCSRPFVYKVLREHGLKAREVIGR